MVVLKKGIFVHPVPGIFYLFFSFIYYSPVIVLLKRRLAFSIPFALKVILAILVIWGTLALGDLADMYGL
jgi:hypothetical protein